MNPKAKSPPNFRWKTVKKFNYKILNIIAEAYINIGTNGSSENFLYQCYLTPSVIYRVRLFII